MGLIVVSIAAVLILAAMAGLRNSGHYCPMCQAELEGVDDEDELGLGTVHHYQCGSMVIAESGQVVCPCGGSMQ